MCAATWSRVIEPLPGMGVLYIQPDGCQTGPHDPTFHGAMIVHYRHRPKRFRKPSQPVEIAVPRIVHHTRRGQAWRPLAVDPEADARVQAFFDRMIRPAPDR
jgi:hypothetical protein